MQNGDKVTIKSNPSCRWARMIIQEGATPDDVFEIHQCGERTALIIQVEKRKKLSSFYVDLDSLNPYVPSDSFMNP